MGTVETTDIYCDFTKIYPESSLTFPLTNKEARFGGSPFLLARKNMRISKLLTPWNIESKKGVMVRKQKQKTTASSESGC